MDAMGASSCEEEREEEDEDGAEGDYSVVIL
jgi:hypothetical protein